MDQTDECIDEIARMLYPSNEGAYPRVVRQTDSAYEIRMRDVFHTRVRMAGSTGGIEVRSTSDLGLPAILRYFRTSAGVEEILASAQDRALDLEGRDILPDSIFEDAMVYDQRTA